MDKDNKYYNLIESLVKNHKKFPGYEAILDDIIDDVYSHSEVILSSINDENVVQAYLEKVISTSIIVVSKKLNYNTRVTHRVISNIPPVKTSSSKIEPTQQESVLPDNQEIESVNDIEQANDINTFAESVVVEKANPKFVDQMINTMNSDLIEPKTELNISDDSETIELELPETKSLEELDTIEPQEISLPEASIDVVDELSEDDISPENLELENSEAYSIQEENEIVREQETVSAIDDSESLLEEVNIGESQALHEDSLELLSDENENNNFDMEAKDEDILEENLDESEESEDISLDVSAEDILSVEDTEKNGEELSTFDIANNTEETELLIDSTDESEVSDDVIELDVSNDSSEMLLTESEEEDDDEVISLELEDSLTETKITEDALNIEEAAVPEIITEEDNSLNESLDFTQDDTLELADNIPNLDVTDELNGEEISIEPDELVSLDEDDNENVNTMSLLNEDDDTELIQDISQNVSDDDMSVEDSDDDTFPEIRLENQKKEIIHKSLDYSVFDYNPSEVHNFVDVKQITENLLHLNSEKPNLQVIKIFDLRYKQNYTLEQIASELNITKDDVITILDDIVELV